MSDYTIKHKIVTVYIHGHSNYSPNQLVLQLGSLLKNSQKLKCHIVDIWETYLYRLIWKKIVKDN